jgi:ArsR family transcriptional regulator
MQKIDSNPLASALSAEKLDFAARVLKLIASPVKLAIIDHLHQNGETSVNDLVEVVGQSQPLLSHHLATLKGGGVVNCRRDGKNIFYFLAMQEVVSVLECMSRCQLPNPQ